MRKDLSTENSVFSSRKRVKLITLRSLVQIQPPQPISMFLDEKMTRTEKFGSFFFPKNL